MRYSRGARFTPGARGVPKGDSRGTGKYSQGTSGPDLDARRPERNVRDVRGVRRAALDRLQGDSGVYPVEYSEHQVEYPVEYSKYQVKCPRERTA